MIVYIIFIFFLCFFTLYYVKSLHNEGVNKWVIPFAFCLKVSAGFIFIYIYSEIYGEGDLSGDAGDFMYESKILNNVFYESPIDYLKFIFGFDDLHATNHYLQEAKHWGAGDQAIINDNRNILKFHSILHFLSFGKASIHMIIMCFLSTIGLIQLVKGIKHFTKLKPVFTFLTFLLLPSLLFWGSGLLKEPFIIIGIGLFVRGVFYLGGTLKKTLLITLGVIFFIGFKPYILLCLIPSIGFYQLFKLLPRFKIIGSLVILSGTLTLLIFAFPMKTNFIIQLLSRKQYDFKNIGKGGVYMEHGENFYYILPEKFDQLLISETEVSKLQNITPDIMAQVNEGKFIALKDTVHVTIINHGGFEEPFDTLLAPEKRHTISYINYKSEGLIDVTLINNSGLQLIRNSGEALVNTLFRPFPTDSGGKLIIQSLIEIWGIYIILIFAFVCRRRLTVNEKGIMISTILFILSLSLLIGWVTPVLGAIVRYKFPVLMAILFISLIIYKVPKGLSETREPLI